MTTTAGSYIDWWSLRLRKHRVQSALGIYSQPGLCVHQLARAIVQHRNRVVRADYNAELLASLPISAIDCFNLLVNRVLGGIDRNADQFRGFANFLPIQLNALRDDFLLYAVRNQNPGLNLNHLVHEVL